MEETTEAEPAFVVVRGRPDHVELAALTAVLLTRLRAKDEADGSADAGQRAPWGRSRRPRPRVGWTASH
ncbi:acyl-CoA carboxylase subunit epsilon [Streptomyces sp. NPDC052773]|uniref:acyl-CoA carboxylase subunit epsilon n=1 Tax=Streptomyces sp. NPDC052773 TaxID=3365693 RepID=UPI002C22578F|nr:acyl-CoA carboxylase subunit epsilon [Streptomyces sp.]